jgi:hypothetical protein
MIGQQRKLGASLAQRANLLLNAPCEVHVVVVPHHNDGALCRLHAQIAPCANACHSIGAHKACGA